VNDRHLTLKALKRRCPTIGLLHHSDQGCPYASEAVLVARGIVCSMSRRGNCYDHAGYVECLACIGIEKTPVLDALERSVGDVALAGLEVRWLRNRHSACEVAEKTIKVLNHAVDVFGVELQCFLQFAQHVDKVNDETTRFRTPSASTFARAQVCFRRFLAVNAPTNPAPVSSSVAGSGTGAASTGVMSNVKLNAPLPKPARAATSTSCSVAKLRV
jgi:hypothetical protein